MKKKHEFLFKKKNFYFTVGSVSPPTKLATCPSLSVTTRILELLLSAINKTDSPFIIPLQIPRGAAKQAVIGSEPFLFSSTPLPIIAEQEFFCNILD